MFRRVIHGTFWLKVLAVGMVFAGASEKSAALLSGGVGLLMAAKQLRDGIREQYWESPEHQAERHWEDLVWGHSQWVNPETPDQGIQRLAGPFHVVSDTPVPDDKHVAFPEPVPLPQVEAPQAPHFINYQEWGTTRRHHDGRRMTWGWGG